MFANTQGLGVHLKCVHGVKIEIKEQPPRPSSSVDGEIKDEIIRDILSTLCQLYQGYCVNFVSTLSGILYQLN